MASTGFTVNRLPPLNEQFVHSPQLNVLDDISFSPLQYDYAPEEPEQEINRRENYRKNQRRTVTRKQQEVRAERDRGRSKERRITGRNRSKSGSRSRQTAEAEESRQRRRSQSRTREWVEDTSEVDYHSRGQFFLFCWRLYKKKQFQELLKVLSTIKRPLLAIRLTIRSTPLTTPSQSVNIPGFRMAIIQIGICEFSES